MAMRITTHLPDPIARDAKTMAENEKKSVSSIIAEAVTYYIAEKKKKRLGRKVLEIAGKVRISPDVYKELEKGRLESDDRT
jgi:metal-responsive CopG/Arc/MetJ family transcriptional regulator